MSSQFDIVSGNQFDTIWETSLVQMGKKSFVAAVLFVTLSCFAIPAQAKVHQITETSIPVPRFGIQTKLPSTERIVALANGSMEVLYSLGLERYVVGRDIASSFRGVRKIPIVTNGHAISAEKVLRLRPTLILINKNTGPEKALTILRKARVKIAVIPDAFTVGDMEEKYRAIIDSVGLKSDSSLAQSLFASIPAGAPSAEDPLIRVAFLYLRGTSSIYLLGGEGSGADQLIAAAGGVDVGSALGLPGFSPITSEAVIQSKPNVLLLMTKGLESVGGIKGLRNLPGIAQTQAGITGNVITVDDSLLLSFGPRTSSLIQQLTKIFESYKEKNT